LAIESAKSIKVGVTFLTPAISIVKNYFAFLKLIKNFKFQEKFNAALLKLQNTGQLTEMASRHMLQQNLYYLDFFAQSKGRVITRSLL
jgi:hypothetical protein